MTLPPVLSRSVPLRSPLLSLLSCCSVRTYFLPMSLQILPGTYNPMPAYRLVTADGVVTLTPGIAARFRAALQAIIDEEIQSPS
jgi:hypothetical protein